MNTSPQKTPRRSGSLYVFALMIGVGLILTLKLGLGVNEGWTKSATDPENHQSIRFTIAKGTTGKQVAKDLKAQGLVSSEWAFYNYLKENKWGDKIQFGTFELSPAMTPEVIVKVITSENGQALFTIPEGWTIDQIDARLVSWGLTTSGEFKACTETCDFSDYTFLEGASGLEGYLFPDSFFIDPGSFEVKGFIRQLLNNFEAKALTAENQKILSESGRTLNEVVIMGSIVEREGLLDEDLSIISGILWKRYDSGWRLDADATLIYVTGKTTISGADLELDSPYNTRKVKGLPPTPIGNPGLASLSAALHPQTTNYWFYLNDSITGKAHFATTTEEHAANKQEWL
ncbi:MAG: adventurous gliding motility protein AgmT [uncultured bacterium]|nr:MAG: adventurous gliding motility protein AgmT [uncultured bacterium]KKT76956.1 MAG: Aminodeoxychorismate lyase [Candidatus Peregrinibacteria bacterium GW2011_GWA2_44_7]